MQLIPPKESQTANVTMQITVLQDYLAGVAAQRQRTPDHRTPRSEQSDDRQAGRSQPEGQSPANGEDKK